jgi:hypothetical protein
VQLPHEVIGRPFSAVKYHYAIPGKLLQAGADRRFLMKRWLTVTLMTAVCSAPLRADVRVTSTTTLEGPMAAMMGGIAPSMVTQIKGSKSRTDIQVGDQEFSTIIDAQTRQIIILNPADRTARVLTPESIPMDQPGAPIPMPKIDASVKPTGQSKLIDGTQCDEQAISLTISMAQMAAGSQMPPQAAEMMKDVKVLMDGSAWIAKSGPGVAEYTAFQAVSAKQSLSTLSQSMPGLGSMGLDRLIESFAGASGLAYLTELTLAIEGGGEMAGLLKQFGDMKFTNRVTDVSTAPLSDDLFTVPADYKVITK